jgi:hypothetical protein
MPLFMGVSITLDGIINIQVDMDCEVRFNYYNLKDYIIEKKGGKNEKTACGHSFSLSALFYF